LRIWLVKEGEPLPCDNHGDRLFRMGMIAEKLAGAGHETVWWSSTFNHAKKMQRYDSDQTIQMASNFSLKLLHSIPYKKNISFSRVIHQVQTAKKFAVLARTMEQPDIIYCAMPTIDLSQEAIKFGKERGIPVILDIRDLWPDIYLDYVSPALKLLISPIVNYSKRLLSKSCKDAFALTALTSEYLRWSLDYAGRTQSEWDKVFYMGYKTADLDEASLFEGMRMWEARGLGHSDFVACFFGQIGHAVDLNGVIKAASLTKSNPRIKYVICGTGEKLQELKKQAAGLSNIIFPGWVNASEILALMKLSSVGIIPYKLSKNYEMNMPNKFAEYLSSGLPVLVSVPGIMKRISEENECGYFYGSPEELAARILELEKSEEQQSIMSRNARSLFDAMFKADYIYGDLVNYLERVVKFTKNQCDIVPVASV